MRITTIQDSAAVIDALPVVHMFWHGPAFSRLERLSLKSFLEHGHPVHLHVYERPDGVPAGVHVIDAAEILSREKVFYHRHTRSIAMFADWFRYRVLLAQGGIWADTDVVCLAPVNYGCDEVYAWQDDLVINNAILGLPAGHELAAWMSKCCAHPNRILPYDDGKTRRRKWRRRIFEGNRRANVKWGEYGPQGLTKAARHLGYADRALPPSHFYPVHYKDWRSVFYAPASTLVGRITNSTAIHLWAEMTRREPNFDKNGRFAPDSLFEQLCARYGVSG